MDGAFLDFLGDSDRFSGGCEFRDQLASGIWMLTTMVCLVAGLHYLLQKSGIKKLLIVTFLYSLWSATEIFVYTFITC